MSFSAISRKGLRSPDGSFLLSLTDTAHYSHRKELVNRFIVHCEGCKGLWVCGWGQDLQRLGVCWDSNAGI